MTLPQAAQEIGHSAELLRAWAQSKEGCPFIVVVKRRTKNSYIVNVERLRMWQRGEIK